MALISLTSGIFLTLSFVCENIELYTDSLRTMEPLPTVSPCSIRPGSLEDDDLMVE